MRFGVVVFPGSNCDRDCQHAISAVTGQEAVMLWHKTENINNVDAIVLPGGFSYGDYLRTGAIARFAPVMQAVIEFANRGGLVIGICNGFQILLEAGLLPGAMLRNAGLSFVCRDICLKVDNANTPFTSRYAQSDVITLPIAHGEGNYYTDQAGLIELEKNNQIVFRYCNNEGTVDPTYSPNGSINNIAGICNKAGNVLGMMPHPERAAENILGNLDGARIFLSMVDAWMKGAGLSA